MEINKIYLGDTLETLKTFPDNFFDVTVTSPPYNKMGAKGGLVNEVKHSNSGDTQPEHQYQDEQIAVLDELHRVTKPHGHIFYNHKLRWLDGIMIHPMTWLSKSKWDMRQEIIWDRGIAGNLQGWRFWQVEERIYWMQKGITKGSKIESRHAKMTSVWRIRPENKFKNHPAPFPIAIPTRCIYSVADNKMGLNILDPYSGTGTTAAAAQALNHNYVGIDCSQEYIDIAQDRFKNNVLGDFGKVAEEMNLHKVEITYAERKQKKSQKF
jgi:site-specific DNA-methyltransferase (adenine-specific)